VPTDKKIESMDINTMMKVVGDHAPAKGLPPRHPMMHRTRSLDYAIILSGEIDMLLDDSEVHLKAGDVVVQQATNHAWVNRSGKPCRVAFHPDGFAGALSVPARAAMSEGVAVPAWLAGAHGGASPSGRCTRHVLVPALRFLYTHPANQVIDELGERLQIGIRPFQRTQAPGSDPPAADRSPGAGRRRAFRQGEPQLGASGAAPRRALRARCPEVQRLFLLPHRLPARKVDRSVPVPGAARLSRRRGHRQDRARCHRGVRDEPPLEHGLHPHAYLAADQAALSYAVGEWARLWPLSP